jgi:hypothetical protein
VRLARVSQPGRASVFEQASASLARVSQANECVPGTCVHRTRVYLPSVDVSRVHRARVYMAGVTDPRERHEHARAWGAGACPCTQANAKLGAVHGFSGTLGGLLHAPHGAICAALLPHCCTVNVAALKVGGGGGRGWSFETKCLD